MKSVDIRTSPRCTKAMPSPFVLTFMAGALLVSLGAQAQSAQEASIAAPAVVMSAPSAESKDERFPVGEMVQKMNDRQVARFEKKTCAIQTTFEFDARSRTLVGPLHAIDASHGPA